MEIDRRDNGIRIKKFYTFFDIRNKIRYQKTRYISPN